MKLVIAELRLDGGTQTRERLDDGTIQEYAEAMGAGAAFPPVVVFHDGQNYWLADGFHRVKAAQLAKFKKISADVRQGTQRDAVLFSVGANSQHGLRRSNADKRRAVVKLLSDPEWQQWSDRVIAEKCGVDGKTVAAVRKETTAEIPQFRKGADGKVREVGRASPPAPLQGGEGREAELDAAAEAAFRAAVGEDEPEREYRYKPGMLAACRKCSLISGPKMGNEWTMIRPGVWKCPRCGKPNSDVLMQIARTLEGFQSHKSAPSVGELAHEAQMAAYEEDEKFQVLTQVAEARPHKIMVDALAVPTVKFGVIVADPPWQYDQQDTPYPSMDLGDIAGLPVEQMAADDCALFLWATPPLIGQALQVMLAWGFEYKTFAFTWVKFNPGFTGWSIDLTRPSAFFMGNGNYTRANAEVCLLGIRGKPERLNKDVRQLILAPVGEHSEKPGQQYERIKSLYSGPYLELFGRENAERPEDWLALGNDLDGQDIRESVQKLIGGQHD